MQIYTRKEISTHNTQESIWVIIGRKVYDLTKFAPLHPGGYSVILEYAGKDVTVEFIQFHSQILLQKYEKFVVGLVENHEQISNYVSPLQKVTNNVNFYGEGIPHGDPMSIQGHKSPYYTKNHQEFRQKCRQFVQEQIEPYIDQWEEQKKTPTELIKKLGENGIISLCMGFPFWFEKLGSQKVFGVELEKPDSFHEIIFYDEFSKAGSGGILWGLLGMPMFGLPPILKFGDKQIQERIGDPCVKGQKVICLAITEPWVGSDVSQIQTTAKRTPCGKFFIVNGMKKWITNGHFADYFTTAVKTEKGITMLAIERQTQGVKTRKMNCTGMWSSGTTFIIFDNVKVPVENIIGQEGNGFKQVVMNFNHERFMFLAQTTRLARTCYEESMKYANIRETFGKKLIEQPVIRQKLANMIKQIESCQAWLEQIAYNMDRMTDEQKNKILSGVIGLGKAHTSQALAYCASEAHQIIGGKAYSRGGQASKVERIYREVKAMAVPGGSEEILLDLGVRNASKFFPKL